MFKREESYAESQVKQAVIVLAVVALIGCGLWALNCYRETEQIKRVVAATDELHKVQADMIADIAKRQKELRQRNYLMGFGVEPTPSE